MMAHMVGFNYSLSMHFSFVSELAVCIFLLRVIV